MDHIFIRINFRLKWSTRTITTFIIKNTNILRVVKFSYVNFTVNGNVISAKRKFCHEKTMVISMKAIVLASSGNAEELFLTNCISQCLQH